MGTGLLLFSWSARVKQPMIDIQRQLKGLSLAEEIKTTAEDYRSLERTCVNEALFIFVNASSEEECQRRAAAIIALTALCQSHEGRDFRRRKNFPSDIKHEREATRQTVHQSPSLSDSLPIKCETTQCIFCLGDEGLPSTKRMWRFSSHGGLKKHLH